MTNKEKLREISRKIGYDSIDKNLKDSMHSFEQNLNEYYKEDLDNGRYLFNPWDGYMPNDSCTYQKVVNELAKLKFSIHQLEFMLSCAAEVDSLEDNIIASTYVDVCL